MIASMSSRVKAGVLDGPQGGLGRQVERRAVQPPAYLRLPGAGDHRVAFEACPGAPRAPLQPLEQRVPPLVPVQKGHRDPVADGDIVNVATDDIAGDTQIRLLVEPDHGDHVRLLADDPGLVVDRERVDRSSSRDGGRRHARGEAARTPRSRRVAEVTALVTAQESQAPVRAARPEEVAQRIVGRACPVNKRIVHPRAFPTGVRDGWRYHPYIGAGHRAGTPAWRAYAGVPVTHQAV